MTLCIAAIVALGAKRHGQNCFLFFCQLTRNPSRLARGRCLNRTDKASWDGHSPGARRLVFNDLRGQQRTLSRSSPSIV
jgi:hypothetical protein